MNSTELHREVETILLCKKIDIKCAIMQAHKTHFMAHVVFVSKEGGWEIHKRNHR